MIEMKIVRNLIDKISLFFFELSDIMQSVKQLEKDVLKNLND